MSTVFAGKSDSLGCIGGGGLAYCATKAFSTGNGKLKESQDV